MVHIWGTHKYINIKIHSLKKENISVTNIFHFHKLENLYTIQLFLCSNSDSWLF